MDPENRRKRNCMTGLRAILAAELRIPPEQVEVDPPFAEMGLNPVMAIRSAASSNSSSARIVGDDVVQPPHDFQLRQLSGHPVGARAAADDTAAEEDSAGSVLDLVRHRRVDVITTKGSPR